jgi:soluble lytic murein transglycosylase-like protein
MPFTRAAFATRRRPSRALAALRRVALGCALAAVCALAAAQTNEPLLTLDGLPRPATPPREVGPVVPERVLGWRREALAYEHGDGVPRDLVRAAELYCRAARYGDADAQYNLAWMLTNSRGIERDDASAAHLFAAAAEQGMRQAQNMLKSMGTPRGAPPPCLRQPEEDTPQVAVAPPAAAAQRPKPLPLSLPPPSNAPAPIVNFVNIIAPDYQLEPQLVLAIMATESNFDPYAVSPRNAQGLMQLIPGTAARFKVRNPMDPAQNIRGGMAYLRWLLAYFEGDITLVAAAYNAGEGAVERYLGVPPYAETRNYVRRIQAAMGGRGTHAFDPSVVAPSPQLVLMRRAVPAR